MPNIRRNRVNDAMRREMAEILRDVKDPRISTPKNGVISVTACDVTPDLKYAKVYYSIMYTGRDGLSAEQAKEVRAAFKSASGFIRRELAMRLNLRVTPELTFIADDSMEKSARIQSMLRDMNLGGDGE